MIAVDMAGSEADSYFVDFVLMAFDSMQQIGKYSKLHSYLPKVIAISRREKNQLKECLALGHMTTICWFEGKYQEGAVFGEQALKLEEQIESLPITAYIKLQFGNLLYGMGDIQRGVAMQLDLIEMLKGPAETDQLGGVLIPGSVARSFLCYMQSDLGLFETAERFGQESIKIAKDQDQPYSHAMAMMCLGRMYCAKGEYSKAQPILEQGYELTLNEGLHAMFTALSGQLTRCYIRQGEVKKAYNISQYCLDEIATSRENKKVKIKGAKKNLGILKTYHYEVLCKMEDFAAAELHRQDAIRIATEIGDPMRLAAALVAPTIVEHLYGCKTMGHREGCYQAENLASEYGFVLQYPMNELQKQQSAL